MVIIIVRNSPLRVTSPGQGSLEHGSVLFRGKQSLPEGRGGTASLSQVSVPFPQLTEHSLRRTQPVNSQITRKQRYSLFSNMYVCPLSSQSIRLTSKYLGPEFLKQIKLFQYLKEFYCIYLIYLFCFNHISDIHMIKSKF